MYHEDSTDIKRRSDALNFKSLKIAGDFNDWQIEPMELKDVGRQTFWIYSIEDSKLRNCKKLNDNGELLVHFKFIDDYNNWFTTSDYATEPDEHNNINNVEVVTYREKELEKDGDVASVKEKMQGENIQKAATDSEPEILDEGPGSPAPSLKDRKAHLQNSFIKDFDVISDALQHLETTKTAVSSYASTINNKENKQENKDMPNIVDESIIESESSSRKNEKSENDDIVEEYSDNNSKLNSSEQFQGEKQEDLIIFTNKYSLNTYSNLGTHKLPIEANMQIVSESGQVLQMPSSLQEVTTENISDAQSKHEDEHVYHSKNNKELNSEIMLENPIAKTTSEESTHSDNSDLEKYVDVENHDLTVPNSATEGYQNILRRLLREFCSWFSWLFDVFNPSQ